MAIKIKYADGAHWYDCRSGTPEPKHDSDLRIARKHSYYPSISAILRQEFVNEFLDKYKKEQLMEAAAYNFKQPHESIDQYCQRIYEISLQHARTASDFGTKIHAAIEHYPLLPEDATLIPWIDKFSPWYNDNILETIATEKILFDHRLGLAGRCDSICRGRGKFDGQLVMPDFKTQGVKKDDKGRKKPNFYDSWVRQLAFYAVSYAKEIGTFPGLIPTCISVVIDSTEPYDPFTRVWTRDEVVSAYEDVVVATYRWFKRKRYYPHPEGLFKIGFNMEMPI